MPHCLIHASALLVDTSCVLRAEALGQIFVKLMLYLQQGGREALAAPLKGSDPSDKAVSDPDSPTLPSRPDESTASGKAHPSTEREENAQSAEAQLLQAVSAPAPVVDPTADIALQGVDVSV